MHFLCGWAVCVVILVGLLLRLFGRELPNKCWAKQLPCVLRGKLLRYSGPFGRVFDGVSQLSCRELLLNCGYLNRFGHMCLGLLLAGIGHIVL